MPIRIVVTPTTGLGSGKYRIQLKPGPRLTFDAFLRYCESSSTLSRSDVLAVLETATEWIVHCRREGKECDLGPLGRSRLGLRGVFDKRPTRIEDDDVELNIYWVLSPKLKHLVRAFGRQLDREVTAA